MFKTTQRVVLILTLLLLNAGIVQATAKVQPLSPANEDWATFAKQHVFMVNNNGWCIDPCKKWGLSDETNKSYSIYRDSLNPIRAGIQLWSQTNSAPDRRVVIFIHGGMNPYSASLDRMKQLGPLMMASNCYPIFVVWNSGPWDSYLDHLVCIRQGEKHPVIGALTSPFVLVSDLAKGVARLPLTLSAQFYNDARTTEWPRDATNCWVIHPKQAARWEGFESLIASNIPSTYHPPQPELNKRTWTERNIRLVEYTATLPTKIATLPVLDGMGTEAWDIMLRRTRTMFEETSTYEIIDKINQWKTENLNNNAINFQHVKKWLAVSETNDSSLDEDAQKHGAMMLFSRAIAAWSCNSASYFPSTNSPTSLNFEFYGHSMGAIVLNEMFANEPSIQAKRIVYLGAACSIEDFENAIFPYLRVHTNTDFYSVSLHRMAEREEYSLYSVPYLRRIPILRDLIVRGSLLCWIDGIFSNPNAITDRTLGSWENITSALPDVPQNLQKRVHFRGCDIERIPIFSRLGGVYEPQIHGNFPNAIFWSTNFFWPIGTNQLKLLTH